MHTRHRHEVGEAEMLSLISSQEKLLLSLTRPTEHAAAAAATPQNLTQQQVAPAYSPRAS